MSHTPQSVALPHPAINHSQPAVIAISIFSFSLPFGLDYAAFRYRIFQEFQFMSAFHSGIPFFAAITYVAFIQHPAMVLTGLGRHHDFWWSRNFVILWPPQMQTILAAVNVIYWRNVKLHRCFVILEKEPLHVLHFVPFRTPRTVRYRHVIPPVTI